MFIHETKKEARVLRNCLGSKFIILSLKFRKIIFRKSANKGSRTYNRAVRYTEKVNAIMLTISNDNDPRVISIRCITRLIPITDAGGIYAKAIAAPIITEVSFLEPRNAREPAKPAPIAIPRSLKLGRDPISICWVGTMG